MNFLNNLDQFVYRNKYLSYTLNGIYRDRKVTNLSGDIKKANGALKSHWEGKLSSKISNNDKYSQLAKELELYLDGELYSETADSSGNIIRVINDGILEQIVSIMNEATDIFTKKVKQGANNFTVEDLKRILYNQEEIQEMEKIEEQERYTTKEIREIKNIFIKEREDIKKTLKKGVSNADYLEAMLKNRQKLIKDLSSIEKASRSSSGSLKYESINKIYTNLQKNRKEGKIYDFNTLNNVIKAYYAQKTLDRKTIGTIAEYIFSILQSGMQNIDGKIDKKIRKDLAEQAKKTNSSKNRSVQVIIVDPESSFGSTYLGEKKENGIVIPSVKNRGYSSWEKIFLENGSAQFSHSSEMTTDLSVLASLMPSSIQELANELGIERINESLKNYSSRTAVSTISNTPLGSSILGLDPFGKFTAHYLNFISSELINEAQIAKGPSFTDFKFGLNILFLMRSLLGIKNSNDTLETAQYTGSLNDETIGANEFIVINDRSAKKVFVYSAYKIIYFLLQGEKSKAMFFENVPGENGPANLCLHNKVILANGEKKNSLALLSRVLTEANRIKVGAKINYTLFD